jgi:hypothetical protein
MRTSQIRKALSQHLLTKPIFGGVCARNRVPPIARNKTVAYIVNTHPHYKPGEHWVAFYFTPTCLYYFDPYGLPPKGFKRLFQARKNNKHFKRRLQGSGRACGHYCLCFILSMVSNFSLNIFGDNLDANDRLAKRQAKMHFNLIG